MQTVVLMSLDGPFLYYVAAPTVLLMQYVVAVDEMITMFLMPAS